MSLKRTHELYRRAVEASRDTSQPQEARDRALDDMLDLRAELDQALIQNAEPEGVSVDRAAGISSSASGSDAVELRELTRPMDNNGRNKYTAISPSRTASSTRSPPPIPTRTAPI